MLGKEPKDWLCFYPFVRSYDWYLLPEAERREMLIGHGKAGQEFPGILSSTVAAFALGDYEWLLALESDDLHEIVDMMRELRYTKARLHVREEVPFYTGRKIQLSQIGTN
jgi:chlorite dismutase